MGQNMFFNYMLRGLGFTVYSAGSRVRRREHGVPVGDYIGWSHVVNIVTLESNGQEGQRYVVDVGFGGDGPTKPLPLTDGVVMHNLGTQEVMLKYENIDSNLDPGQKLWVYKIWNHEADVRKDVYCFAEVEFLPQDFSVMSYFVNNSPSSWFTTTVVAVKKLLDEHGKEVVAKETLFGAEVKRNMGGKTRLVRTCTTEEERVQVLGDMFGLVLSEEEREGITGSAAAL
jgi:arylamine N-acetyltransferase